MQKKPTTTLPVVLQFIHGCIYIYKRRRGKFVVEVGKIKYKLLEVMMI